MPTLEHNGLVELFRENPALAPHLIEMLFHVKLPPYASVAVVEAALDQLIPVEFRADLVLELHDAEGALVLAIVLELQRDKDPRKKGSWPVYIAPIHARNAREKAVLDQEHAAVYFQIVYDALREPMRRALEAKIMERQTEAKANFPPFVQRLVEGGKLEGFRDGQLEGFRDGRLEGLRDGRLEGLREALLRLLARVGIALTEADRARIQACDDAAILDRWLENVLGAKTAGDVLS